MIFRNITFLLLTTLTLFTQTACSPKEINVADFGAKPDGSDCTPAVLKAIAKAKSAGGGTIVFGAGTYCFGGDFAPDMFVSNSNNDSGIRRVVFPLVDCQNITIDGRGAKFIFDGRINPFVVKNSKNIFFKNFSCDLARSGHSEAEIIEAQKDALIVKIDEKRFPYELKNGMLIFVGNKNSLTTSQLPNNYYRHVAMLEFDPKTRAVAYNARDYFLWRAQTARADKLPDGNIKIHYKGIVGTKGNIIVFGLGERPHPMFAIDASTNVSLNSITVFDAIGMGLIAQNSRDIFLEKYNVEAGEGRIVSCAADATHFVSCEGKIVLNNCSFAGQMDDATNIHGIYERVKNVENPTTLITELVHNQQYSVNTFKAGDEIEFVDRMSMKTKAKAKIKSVEILNNQFKRVVLDAPVPEGCGALDSVAKIRDYPEIIITNNKIWRNRARGMLLNCRGKTRVENNYFSSSGAALYFEGDARYWFEQGGVRDCVIRNNVFENCNYAMGWGSAVIEVAAGISADKDTSRYNRNIVIEDNTFRMYDASSLLKIYCVDNLTWRKNKVEKTTAYPPKRNLKPFVVENSSNISIK